MAAVEEPYVGLGHFTEEYADRFFGRDTECSLIIGNLRAARLTLLYAESGVGKSSVLRAGVVARLHEFADRDLAARGRPRLVPVVFSTWSEAPVAGLVRAVEEGIRPYLPEGEVPELPADDLERALEIASGALDDATLLVVLDQFEEYFLYPEETPEDEQVAAQIARCVNRADLRANFLISIREDSYARLGDLFRGKVSNVYANFLHLDFLHRDGAREAIEKPVDRIDELLEDDEDYELEPALVDAVLDQVGRRAGENGDDGHGGDGEPTEEVETTYLQLVMRRLWEEEAGSGSHLLRLQTLEELGGAQAVIRGHLDRAMGDDGEGGGLSAEQRLVAARIFHFLVTSGGTKIALTAGDLADLSGRSVAEIDPVLQHLASPRLHILRPVVSENGRGEPRYEIFHDALAEPIVAWRTRVEDEELDKRLRRERAEKEKAQEAAARAERQAARERRRKRGALILLWAVLSVLVIGAFLALIEQEKQTDRSEAAEKSVKAAERISELARAPSVFDPAAAALAGVAAHRLSPTTESRDVSLGQLQLNPGMPLILAGHTRGVDSIVYWPGSPNLASGGNEGTVRLWGGNGRRLGEPLVTPYGEVESIAVSPAIGDERIVAVGIDSPRAGSPELVLWRVDSAGNRLGPKKEVHLLGPPRLAFDPQAPKLLVAGVGNQVTSWDVTGPNPTPTGSRPVAGTVNDLAFAPDGRRLLVATASAGQELGVAGAKVAAAPPRTLLAEPSEAVAVAANGSYAFAGRRGVDLWDARHRHRHLRLAREVTALAFARGGAVLVSASRDWNVVTWDVASGRPFGPPRASEHSTIRDVAVSPDGSQIAAASGESLIKLWSLQPRHPLALTVAGLGPRELGSETTPDVEDLAVTSDGHMAVATGAAGASIWKLGDLSGTARVPRPLIRFPGSSAVVASHGNSIAVGRGRSFVVMGVGPLCRDVGREPCHAVAPARPHSEKPAEGMVMRKVNGRLLVASSGSVGGAGVVNMWEVTGSGRIEHLATRSTPVGTEILSLAFSRDGTLVAAAASDGKARVWDVSRPRDPDGVSVRTARGAEAQPVGAIAFSPDGTLLATAGGDQQVVLWTVTRHGSKPPTVVATAGNLFQSQRIDSLSFSLDGSVLAAGDGSGRTCLYQVANRNAIGGSGCLVGHEVSTQKKGGIDALRFADVPGLGSVLLTGGVMQPIVAWRSDLWNLGEDDAANDQITADVCRLARRDLSGSEWEEAFGALGIGNDHDPICTE